MGTSRARTRLPAPTTPKGWSNAGSAVARRTKADRPLPRLPPLPTPPTLSLHASGLLSSVAAMPSEHDLALAKLCIERGYATREQVRECLREADAGNRTASPPLHLLLATLRN